MDCEVVLAAKAIFFMQMRNKYMSYLSHYVESLLHMSEAQSYLPQVDVKKINK